MGQRKACPYFLERVLQMNQYDEKITKFQGMDADFYKERRLNPKSEGLVETVKDLEDVCLELHMRRLCVYGKTYPYKKLFKSLGFKWDRTQRYWYKHMTFNLVS